MGNIGTVVRYGGVGNIGTVINYGLVGNIGTVINYGLVGNIRTVLNYIYIYFFNKSRLFTINIFQCATYIHMIVAFYTLINILQLFI